MTAPRDPIDEAQQLQALGWAVGEFLMQFAALESRGVTQLFQWSLRITDVDMLEHLEELMPLEGRLKLMKRVATGRKNSLEPQLLKELISLANKIDVLRLRRNEVAHGASATWFVAEGEQRSKAIIGLQLPKSQREPIAGETLEERTEKQKQNVITASQIRDYKQEAVDLSYAIMVLITKMSDAHKKRKAAGSSDSTEPPKP